jgi:hypothetical protein
MSHCTFEQVIDCSAIEPSACSDRLLVALGHGDDFKLRADSATDVVHGSVAIVHNSPPDPHEVTVDMYDADEGPCAEHQTTFRCPDSMPSTADLQQRAQDGWE